MAGGGGMGGVSSTGYGQPSGGFGPGVDNYGGAQQRTDGTMPGLDNSQGAYNTFLAQAQFAPGTQAPTYDQWVAGRSSTAQPMIQQKPSFDEHFYLQQNPDVVKDWRGTAYEHYMQHGMNEGRLPYAPQTQQAPVAQTPYQPVTTTFSAQQQGPVFNAPVTTQSGGEGSGGAMNFQYNRGGIASLLRR